MKSRLFVALFVLVGCNAGDAIVGGHCSEGFSESNGACVPSTSDPSSSSSSSPSYGFANGTATLLSNDAPKDPSTNDPSSGDPSSSSTSTATGGAGSASRPDGGATSDTDAGSNADAGSPLLQCDGALVACHGECIPVANDGANCGACGKVCPSNLCVEGECQGALAGDVIVLGHDSSSPHAKMIANAFSIATTDPIRVLAFDGSNTNAAAERTLIASTIRFRSVAYTTATDADLEATDLAKKFDVVLVQDAGLSASYLGARTRGAFDTFTKKGGIVVAIDDGASDMPAFLRDSGLLSIDGHAMLASDAQVVVSAPNDALGVQVLSPYAPSGASVGFLGVSNAADVTVVAHTNDEAALPTAIHRFVR